MNTYSYQQVVCPNCGTKQDPPKEISGFAEQSCSECQEEFRIWVKPNNHWLSESIGDWIDDLS